MVSRFCARFCMAGLLFLFRIPAGTTRPDFYTRTTHAGAFIANYHIVSLNSFHSMGVRVVGGREFDARDTTGSQGVAIINEALARRLWPDEGALGRFLAVGFGKPTLRRIIGIVADLDSCSLAGESPAEIYLPSPQCASQLMFFAADRIHHRDAESLRDPCVSVA